MRRFKSILAAAGVAIGIVACVSSGNG